MATIARSRVFLRRLGVPARPSFRRARTLVLRRAKSPAAGTASTLCHGSSSCARGRQDMPTQAWAWHPAPYTPKRTCWRRWRRAGCFFVGWASSPDPLSDERGRSSYEEPNPRRQAPRLLCVTAPSPVPGGPSVRGGSPSGPSRPSGVPGGRSASAASRHSGC